MGAIKGSQCEQEPVTAARADGCIGVGPTGAGAGSRTFLADAIVSSEAEGCAA